MSTLVDTLIAIASGIALPNVCAAVGGWIRELLRRQRAAHRQLNPPLPPTRHTRRVRMFDRVA